MEAPEQAEDSVAAKANTPCGFIRQVPWGHLFEPKGPRQTVRMRLIRIYLKEAKSAMRLSHNSALLGGLASASFRGDRPGDFWGSAVSADLGRSPDRNETARFDPLQTLALVSAANS